mgnify:CR=1 FL=1
MTNTGCTLRALPDVALGAAKLQLEVTDNGCTLRALPDVTLGADKPQLEVTNTGCGDGI